jgi:hypothetical protein
LETVTRITVNLSADERRALMASAQREYRHPREQARYLLRRALLGESAQPAESSNRTGVRQDMPSAVAQTISPVYP